MVDAQGPTLRCEGASAAEQSAHLCEGHRGVELYSSLLLFLEVDVGRLFVQAQPHSFQLSGCNVQQPVKSVTH
eukprot:19996-Eustigmatos_ZCMA.PRE.1